MPHSERITYLLRSADQAITGEMNRALRDLHLTATQYVTLLVLSESEGMSGAQLSRACHVSPQTMASILVGLATRNLVERRPAQVHQQVLVARLTREGRALLRQAEEQVRSVECAVVGELSDTERASLLRILRAMTERISGLN